ncbi:MAG: hypothetical protein JXR37_34770 [Kiritimatiellae bacterium]|nr:hypothetical protein [Kiritimatiellia bacterium]
MLLYDTFHDLDNPGAVLRERHRILKPRARLSFSDHHMRVQDVLSAIGGSGLFERADRKQTLYTFLSVRE